MSRFFYLIPHYRELTYFFKTPKTVDEIEFLLTVVVEKLNSSGKICYLNDYWDARSKCFQICKGRKDKQGFIRYFAELSTDGVMFRFHVDKKFSSIVFVSPAYFVVRKVKKMELIFDEIFTILCECENETVIEACTKGCMPFSNSFKFNKKEKPLAYQWLLAKSSGLVSYNQFQTPFLDTGDGLYKESEAPCGFLSDLVG